jgi:hypothetical protein
MKRPSRLFSKGAALLILALAALSAQAIEVERGDLRLVLHESSARFSLYLRHDGEWVSLFVTEDPRTSGIEVLEGNNIYRIGDSGSFDQLAEEISDGARFVWTSPTLRITQSFHFTRGVRAADFNAVEMEVTVTNRGEEPSLVGVRLILDTYLGERDNTHFATPGLERVTREARLEPGPVNAWVASVPEPGASYGFQVMLDDEAITRPEAALIANWKRLTDSSWDYDVNETRNFNRLPYSINDSALMVIYEAAQLRSGDTYAVVSHMGDLSPDGYLAPQLAAETTGENPLLEQLARLVDRLNTLIAADEVDVDQVREIQAQLEALSILVRGE